MRASSPYGIIVCQVIRDDQNKVIDFVHLRANAATAAQTDFVQHFPIYDRTLHVTAFRLSADEFIISFYDITELEESRLQLARHRDHLEELIVERTQELEISQGELGDAKRLASVGTLAAGIAHEINDPVGAILHAAELALLSEEDAEVDLDAIRRRALLDIVDLAGRCGRIVKGIMQFSRGDPSDKWESDLDPAEKDEQGIPLARIHTHLDEGEIRRLAFMAKTSRAILEAADASELTSPNRAA